MTSDEAFMTSGLERSVRNQKSILSIGTAILLFMPASVSAFHADTYNSAERSSALLISTQESSQEALTFIKDLAKRGIGFLEDQTLSDEERKKEFRNVLKNSFDMKTIGRFALGRYWRGSSTEQKKEYLSLFESMVVDVYSRRFSDYNGQAFEVVSAREQGNSDSVVLSHIIPPSGPKITVEWRVRKDKKSGQQKIIDIIVEGVSMSVTQRSDFASVIQRGGGNVDVLLAHLRPQ